MPRESPALTEVVCVCSRRDVGTWKVAARNVVRHIPAARYRLYVPDDEVPFFEAATPAPFQVLPESILIDAIRPVLIEAMAAGRRDRVGWYLQQFIKLAAVRGAAAGEVVLIWDADTIPLRPLQFVSGSGRIRYYKGGEHHLPYFDLIRRLVGLERQVDFSFVAQCFAIRAEWMHELCAKLETEPGLSWFEAIIRQIDFTEESGFSEYETLGTFIAADHGREIEFSDRPWSRYGSRLTGGIEYLDEGEATRLARRYDFVSFEHWERRPRWPALHRIVMRLRG
ncbi:MAG: hypothetical protein KF909_05820 [Rhodocyclaceae bacterium]|nr:hypothetical protein [Rhodocyclaceae bacterium]